MMSRFHPIPKLLSSLIPTRHQEEFIEHELYAAEWSWRSGERRQPPRGAAQRAAEGAARGAAEGEALKGSVEHVRGPHGHSKCSLNLAF